MLKTVISEAKFLKTLWTPVPLGVFRTPDPPSPAHVEDPTKSRHKATGVLLLLAIFLCMSGAKNLWEKLIFTVKNKSQNCVGYRAGNQEEVYI